MRRGEPVLRPRSYNALKVLHGERRAAATGASGVGVDDVESLADQGFLVVQRDSVEVNERLGIDEDARAVEFVDAIGFARTRVDAHGVGEPRAAAAFDAEPQAAFFSQDAFLGQNFADVPDGAFSNKYAIGLGLRYGGTRRSGSTFRGWLSDGDDVGHDPQFP